MLSVRALCPGTPSPALPAAPGPELFVSGERAVSRRSRLGGELSALSFCSSKGLCCQTLMGIEEKGCAPPSSSRVTGTTLPPQHRSMAGALQRQERRHWP